MIRDLASLLAPLPEQTFFEHFLEKRRLHVESDDLGRAVPLFPWTVINRLIDSGLLPSDRLRVVRANTPIPPTMFRQDDGTQGLRAGALSALLRQGVSLVINGIGDVVPEIGRIADAIERRLGHETWVNAYLSFGRGSAFRAHWDAHDVLILQVHGHKQWRSYGTPMPYPLENHGPKEPFGKDVVWEGVIGPGDVLYLPRGEIHEAVLAGQHSVHLTIGVRTPTGIDFLHWLAKKAVADVVARADLTRLGGKEMLTQRENQLKSHLHALIDATALSAYFDADDTKRKPRSLLSVGLVEALDADTVVIPAPRRSVDLLLESDAESEIVIGGEAYRLSPAARRVLDLLIARNEISFGELAAAIGGAQQNQTLRQAVIELTQKGLAGLEFRPRLQNRASDP